MMSVSQRIGLYAAILHCFGFIVLVVLVNISPDPQGPLLWGIFAIIDFPISLLYFTGRVYGEMVHSLEPSFIARLLYLPYLMHGLLGTIWWYFLPRLVTPKKIGGIWGKSN